MKHFKMLDGFRPALIISLLLIGCSDSSPELRVKTRLETYVTSWKKHDFKKIWSIMSQRLKKGNDNDPLSLERFVEKQGIYIAGADVHSIKINGNSALVRATISYADFAGKIGGKEENNCSFVEVDEEWYFDECKPLT